MDAHYIYPPLSPTDIRSYERTTSDHFDIHSIINECSQRMCFSVSLFKRNPNNTFDGEFPVNDDTWTRRYLNGLVKNIHEIKSMGMALKIRVYLARDLSALSSLFIAIAPSQVEIYVMASNSIGHGPGALWRFLALSDATLDAVSVADIDDRFDRIYIDKLMASNNDVILCKRAARRPELHFLNDRFWGQYHLFQAGMFAMRPVRTLHSEKSIKPFMYDMLCGMTQYAIDERFDKDTIAVTAFNVPRAGHPNGWGRHPYVYGFDETFLKCLLYPLMTRPQVVFIGEVDQLELSVLRRNSCLRRIT